MSFLYPSLLAAPFLLVLGLPVLIHLINLMRQKRIKWAAMDFLLQSQRKNRRWVLLKEWLLMALRVLALAAILLMLAQPVLRSTWNTLLGGSQTHHVVLLDDSYSMADQSGPARAFAQATGFLAQLVDKCEQDTGRHRISLIRFSAAAPERGSRPQVFDLLEEEVTPDVRSRLETLVAELRTSQTDMGPLAALDEVRRLDPPQSDERRRVYLVSDFRRKDWSEATSLRQQISDLAAGGAEVHLVHCADPPPANLSILHLRPAGGAVAAGVEFFLELAVHNFGQREVRDVVVQLEEDGHRRPAVVFDAIGPAETAARKIRVSFPAAGQHTVSARLEDDSTQADNVRYRVVRVTDTQPVLLVDGAPRARDAYFVATALAPGGTAVTGLSPVIHPPSYLRTATDLDKYAAIYLLNIDELAEAAVDAVRQFVRDGGGVVFFLGERCNSAVVNAQLFRDGNGLFPLALGVPTNLIETRDPESPDLIVDERHPVFSGFAQRNNTFLDQVRVYRYFSVRDEPSVGSSSPAKRESRTPDTARVIVKLRNGAPLVVEKPFGEGRVVAVLTKASPEETSLGQWNTWAQGNPSFVVTLLELQSYLARSGRSVREHLVGWPLSVPFDGQRYTGKVRFRLPPGADQQTVDVDAEQGPEGLVAICRDVSTSGIYRLELVTREGEQENEFVACNVAAEEGDLHRLDRGDIASRLPGVPYTFHRAAELQDDARHLAGVNLSETLLIALVVLLCGEQLLAYAASYHPSRRGRP